MRERRVFSPVLAAMVFAGIPAAAWGQAAGERTKSTASDHEPAQEDSDSFLRNLYLEVAPEFDAGKFGTKNRSSLLYLPATLGYDHDGVVASVTVPYQIQRTHAPVVFIGGRPVRVGKKKAGKVKTVGGLGDVYLDGGYYVFEEHDGLPSLELEGEVKFPTADDERGLGTGSYDGALKAYSGITLFSHLKFSGYLGYGWIGQPEDIPDSVQEFHDIVYYGVGAGYKFTRENELWLKFDANTRITDGTPQYQTLTLEWDHYFKNENRLFLSLGFGLTNASPALALSLGYQFWF
jgi:hypothetical protein